MKIFGDEILDKPLTDLRQVLHSFSSQCLIRMQCKLLPYLEAAPLQHKIVMINGYPHAYSLAAVESSVHFSFPRAQE